MYVKMLCYNYVNKLHFLCMTLPAFNLYTSIIVLVNCKKWLNANVFNLYHMGKAI
jgi:hypothetical protein